MVKKYIKKLDKALGNNKNISLVFLGIGLSLFLLNISGLLAFLPVKYSFSSFDIPVFSSMLIILFSVYILHNER